MYNCNQRYNQNNTSDYDTQKHVHEVTAQLISKIVTKIKIRGVDSYTSYHPIFLL